MGKKQKKFNLRKSIILGIALALGITASAFADTMDVSPVDPVHSKDTEGMIYDATYEGYGGYSNGYFWTDLGHYEVRDADGHIVTGLYTPFFYHTYTSVWDLSKGDYKPVHKGDGSEMLCAESMSNITVGEMDRVLKALYQNDLSVYQAINGTIGEDGEQVEGIKQKLFTKVVATDLGNGKTKYDYESESGKVIGTSYDTNTTYSAVRTNGAQNTNQVSVYTITDSNGAQLAEIIDTDTKYTAGNGIAINGTEISTTVVDTNTQYSVKSTTKTGSTVTEYDIVDASDETKSIGKIVDTNTKYTVSAAAGTGNVVNTYTLTDSDGNALTQIVDTDTTYEAGTNVEIKDGKIYAKDTTYSAGKGIAIDPANGNKISAKIGTGLKFGGVDEDIIMVDTTNTNLSYKASGDTESKSVSLATGLTFAGDNNILVSTDENTAGLVNYQLNPNVSVTSVTAGNTVLNATGLTIGTNTYVSTSGLNANNQKITNVANGTDTYDAVNYGQLQSAISGGTSTNDIKSIQTKSDGTINLIRNDNSSVDGGLTITSAGGTDGADKTITIAGMNGDTASAITLNAGSVVTGTDSNSDGYLDSLTINGTGLNIKQYSEGAGINITGTDNAISVDVGDGMKIDGDKVAAKLGAGLGLDTAKAITVLAEQNKGISVSDNGIGVIANTNKGITVDASGVAVKIDNNSLTFDDNGYIKVNTALTSLKYRANGAAQPLSVSLDQGLDFKNGTNTTASVDVNGEVKYDLNKDVTLTDGSLIVTDADGAGNVVIQNGSITGPGYALRNDGSVSFANGSFSIASNGNITSSFGNGGHILADNGSVTTNG